MEQSFSKYYEIKLGLGLEFVDTIEIGFNTCCHDVGIGSETIIELSIVFYLHMHFSDVVGALGNGLNGKLLHRHLLENNLL